MFNSLNFYLLCLVIFTATDMNAQRLSRDVPVKLLALGDSYTIGESVAELQRWPVQLANALRQRGHVCDNPEIVAVTGWRTDQLMKALAESSHPRNYTLVSLLIGVNNQYQGKSIQEYGVQFEHLLREAIAYAGGDAAKVFVLSIPDYGYTPFGLDNQAVISAQIDAFNEINKAITERNGVTYINITDISRRGLQDPYLLAEDGLHPSGKMYALWVERILDAL